MENRELVFVPAPAFGHLVSAAKLAKRLVDGDSRRRISVTFLNMKMPYAQDNVNAYFESLSSSFPEIRFVDLPPADPLSLDGPVAVETFISLTVESYKPHVKEAISQLISTPTRPIRPIGLVIDIFFTALVDVANELGIPTFLYYTSSAAMLGFMLHLPILHTQFTSDFKDSETEFNFPSFFNSVPLSVFPYGALNKQDDGYKWYLYHGRRYRETKGMIVNTFSELEPRALGSFEDGRTPAVYPVGPVLDVEGKAQFQGDSSQQGKIMRWLDNQPRASVVLLCFGSLGGLDAVQATEIAVGLEKSGHRFLWSLRNPPQVGSNQPSAPEDPRNGLPEGFEERMEGKGLVCEWLPQVRVLGHEAIGGFVSHCGWNSILESLWFGVPMATWPLYAEQQLNAFEMVKELGLAVEIRMDYRMGGGQLVKAEEVERGVRKVMEGESELRKRVAEMRDKSRNAINVGGSSITSLGRLIEDLLT